MTRHTSLDGAAASAPASAAADGAAAARPHPVPVLRGVNDVLFRVLAVIASLCLAALTVLVFYAVVMRYVFENAPDFVEPIALLLVIVIAMFGAAMKVRDGGHIGLDSFVRRLNPRARDAVVAFQHLSLIGFAIAILVGCGSMAVETMGDRIPIIGLPEGVRYLITIPAAVAIILFSLEHLLALRRASRP
ncbi:TRAP transporter small permease [Burkholderia multivorans]|uniref:TRAP transporter small permease n=1 Tax=Burkholderia multivorans TaxID=87883 RepID=UPI000CFFE82C|nr:TRAP transporter small permease [Burkholderia multivorans]MBR8242610.1 TRAP transporter small permease [Burkholderia multivorans]MDR9173443.1 2,3-diketo-L-gulonate TRAP transporter small permease protein YiaM [Burkholderia multivorans]MDR9181345.1 2,3-diketo-L-gulonate TRAP transporter small permease protein YiaM [Burkholderia multivorans]MDR9186785.1 2,3-diketo-L-gulonate TRAP transporter small permease protein YiaM [Burkholderia multivorans]MDR9192496.1 2,3-diketo-L-gulonate TRAP transpor